MGFDVEVGHTGVTLLVAPEALEVRLPTIEWTTAYGGPTASSRFWKRVRGTSIGNSDDCLLEPIERRWSAGGGSSPAIDAADDNCPWSAELAAPATAAHRPRGYRLL
jgi:hypothetical protein